uniref:Retrovirus-related Pol polyprotein from transposon TNT 1-94 n=1 Tax=Cajanus cajan TaxID=3821 RepID=A0A151U7J4_CAJCA|nr:hypothetical protein KK1_007905 [Cajanus cajan]
MKIWFLGQRHFDHLTLLSFEIDEKLCDDWEHANYLVFVLWQSVEPIGKLDTTCMIFVLHGLHKEYDNVQSQILATPDIPSTKNLVRRLIRLPNSGGTKEDGSHSGLESSALVSNLSSNGGRGRGYGRGHGGGKTGRGGGRPQCTYCKRHYITLSYGSKVKTNGVHQVILIVPLPTLSLDFVLLVPNCPFNLISNSHLNCHSNCSITFTSNSSFIVQGQSTRQTIGTGSSSVDCNVIESPNLFHRRLGHPSL